MGGAAPRVKRLRICEDAPIEINFGTQLKFVPSIVNNPSFGAPAPSLSPKKGVLRNVKTDINRQLTDAESL